MRIVTIIVAAGRGSRAGGGLPKQYRHVGGRPLLSETLAVFLGHYGVDAVLCAIHPDDRHLYDAAVAALPAGVAGKLLEPVAGGATRQVSVAHALEGVSAGGHAPTHCLVHDAARPFVDHALIDRAIAAGLAHDAAVPGVAPTDTVKRVDDAGIVVETLDRAALRTIQTPQAFSFGPCWAPIAPPRRRASTASRMTASSPNGQACRFMSSPETRPTSR